MIVVHKKKELSSADLKCICLGPLAIGSDSKQIKYVEKDGEVMLDSNVSALKGFENGILFGLADGQFGFLNENDEKSHIKLHNAKISAIDSNSHSIATGSWDNTAILLKRSSKSTAISINESFYDKFTFPHPNAVWAVKLLEENTFVTGCADTVIRIYNLSGVMKSIDYHNSVVRGLLVDDSCIYSVDNYGTVMKISRDGKILKCRFLNEMCFCIAAFEQLIVVGGRNGSLFIIDNENLIVLEKITLSCPNCWSIGVKDGEIMVTGSNGILYFLKAGEKGIEGDNAASTSTSAVSKDGEYNSGSQKYKIKDGKVYVQKGTEWDLIGETEKTFDHSFSVELENKVYTLSFNDSDNVHEVASKFIAENKLDKAHHTDIVNYINANFKKSTIYKKYETIDISGISKVLGDHPILEVLKKVVAGENFSLLKSDPQNIYQIEDLLLGGNDIPLFIVLDICKYLAFKGLILDLSFVFRCDFLDKKEAKAFVYLMTNIIEDPPFNINPLNKKIRSLKDKGYLSENDLSKYDENYCIKNRQKTY